LLDIGFSISVEGKVSHKVTQESVNFHTSYPCWSTASKTYIDKDAFCALHLIYRVHSLSFEHFPRGVVNIFAIYVSILHLIRDSIFFGPVITCSGMRITALIKILVKIFDGRMRHFTRDTAKTKSYVNCKYLIKRINHFSCSIVHYVIILIRYSHYNYIVNFL